MKREDIILSDLDLKILKFIIKERCVKDLVLEFDMNNDMIKKHLDRLDRLKCYNKRAYGNFRFILINKKGEHILNILHE